MNPRETPELLQYLREAIFMDMETGHLFWTTRPRSHFQNQKAFIDYHNRCPGRRCDEGSYLCNGYGRVRITVHGKKMDISAHRVAFALANGAFPRHTVDHIDGNRRNNAPRNLRDVTASQNSRLGAERRRVARSNKAACTHGAQPALAGF